MWRARFFGGRGEDNSFHSSSKLSNPPNIKVPFYTSEKNMYAPIIVIKIVRCPQLHVWMSRCTNAWWRKISLTVFHFEVFLIKLFHFEDVKYRNEFSLKFFTTEENALAGGRENSIFGGLYNLAPKTKWESDYVKRYHYMSWRTNWNFSNTTGEFFLTSSRSYLGEGLILPLAVLASSQHTAI